MATLADVAAVALALPETSERTSGAGARQWRVKDTLFVWERPLRRADLAALAKLAKPGDAAPVDLPPDGLILGARVVDLVAKEARLAEDPDFCFTIPHFAGYPAVLIRLDRIDEVDLRELITDAWLARAPKRLVRTYLGTGS